MANDHYIPKVLTRPWEHEHRGDQRQLSWFRFSDETFDVTSARNLFAKRDLNTPEVEDMLERYIETPLGNYLDHPRREGVALPPADDWQVTRALALLLAFNVQRLLEAQADSRLALKLEDFQRKGEGHLDAVAQYWLSKYKIAGVTLPENQELFFTQVASFPIPFAADPAALAIPLSTHHLLIHREADLPVAELNRYIAFGTFETLSIGVGPSVDVVVLPEFWRRAKATNEVAARADLLEMRRDARGLCARYLLDAKASSA